MSDEHLPTVVEPTPLLLIQQALDAKIAPSDLKELFDLQVRYEQRRAEEAYANAITAFQAGCPPITNTKPVLGKDGKERYRYAPFEEIMRVIMPHLRAHRIVISFDTKPREGGIEVTCRVRVGVVEKCTTVLAAFQQANAMMNDTQVGRAAESYGKRGAITLALNLVCTDEDTDAQEPDDSNEPAGAAAIDELDDLLKRYEEVSGQKADVERLLKWVGCKSIGEMNRGQWRKACDGMDKKIAAAKKGGAA